MSDYGIILKNPSSYHKPLILRLVRNDTLFMSRTDMADGLSMDPSLINHHKYDVPYTWIMPIMKDCKPTTMYVSKHMSHNI